jgi:hypothetical protein
LLAKEGSHGIIFFFVIASFFYRNGTLHELLVVITRH